MRNNLIDSVRQRVESQLGEQSHMTIIAHHTNDDSFLIELTSGRFLLTGKQLIKFKKPTGVFKNAN